jgi:peptidoglycan/LPS O-acetylase OafA/YrhL
MVLSSEHSKPEVPTPAGLAIPERNSFGERYEFLDALRGVAALLVVIEHIFEQYFPAFGEWTLTHFRLGEFGVTVFFLVSGYIIPASLERRGSLKEFWIGRFFRLFPLYWLCLAAVLLLHFLGAYRGLSGEYLERWRLHTLINLSMVQDFTGAPLAMGQSWTLAYEMAFYVIVSVLFVAGWHKRPAIFAAVGLGISMVIGNPLAPRPLADMSPARWLLLAVLIAVMVGVTVLLTRSRPQKVTLVCVVIAAVLATGLFNRPEAAWTAIFFLATMFFGNCAFRWSTGVLASRPFILLGMLAFVAIVIAQEHDWSPWLHAVPEINGAFHLSEVLTFGGAYVVFLTALLYREVSYPKVLMFLGRISYSLYLVHSVVLYTLPSIDGQPLVSGSLGVLVTIAVSALTYRWVEQPAIALGRRVVRRRRDRERARQEASVDSGGDG